MDCALQPVLPGDAFGDDGEIKGGTGHWPVPSGDPPDGTGEALFLPAETGSPSPPLSAQPGW